jgi:flagellar hook protein FlgE
MSFLRSLFSGVSGLQNHQTMMDVIGNNIANINTVGYKGSRASFSETFSQTLRSATQPTSDNGGTNPLQVGLGMSVSSVDTLFTQGSLQTTGNATDLAIQGSSFFAVNKNGQTFYTRAGSFTFDSTGTLVSSGNGAIVQGKLADSSGVLPTGTQLQDIKIALDQKSPAKATSEVDLTGNLNSDAVLGSVALSGNVDPSTAVGGTVTQTFTVADDYGTSHTVTATLTKTAADTYSVAMSTPGGTITGGPGTATFDATTGAISSFTPSAITLTPTNGAPAMSLNVASSGLTQTTGTSSVAATYTKATGYTDAAVTAYDSLGNQHSITIRMSKTSNTNEWTWAAITDSPATISSGQTGKILFNTDGSLKSFNYDDGSTSLNINPNNGADAMSIALNAGTAGSFTGISQLSSSSSVTPSSQNGYASGTMSNISVDTSGKIIGTFTNGTVMTLGEVLLANFNNPSGLVKTGDNLYDISGNSGEAAIVEAGVSTSSTIQSGSLEQSNVDLSEQFTQMIIAQRGFQANARVITTSDDFLNELVNLKRA